MSDERWMAEALSLAECARGKVDPNPAVGCVLVHEGVVVGQGWTRPPGGPHAEVVALSEAGSRAHGATAYVTLEPCDHEGRTGPCSIALMEAGVARVVVAIADPSEQATGGIERLRSSGVEVRVGVRADQARRQNPAFFAAHDATPPPEVTVKVAISLDGRIAAVDGTSQWLTGERTRAAAHELRAQADAIVVGSQTALEDDPRLTVRLGDGSSTGPRTTPLRVVLDGRARTPPTLRVYDAAAPSVVVVDPEADTSALEAAGVTVWRVGGDRKSGEDLRNVLGKLDDCGGKRVLVEGGSRVAGAFLAAGLAERLVVHVAPLLLGPQGLPALDLAVPTLSEAPRWRLERIERIDDDAVLSYVARKC